MAGPIVVGVDGSGRSLRALAWASHEAVLHGCALRVIHVLPGAHEYGLSAGARASRTHERDRGVVDEATAIAREAHPDLEVTSDLPSGSPAAVLLSESEHAHTVVLGAKGMGGFASLLLGSVAVQVVGHTACPVVIVNHVTTGNHRIVVGADGSAHSQAALAYAFREASLRGDQLQAVHAWSPPGPPALVSSDPTVAEALSERRRALEEWLAPLRQEYPGVKAVEDLVQEAPVLALARASDRADLMVVGSRGRGGFHGLALGSVSHALLQFSLCPLAVVRPRP
ncbi:universal stress protein [Streptomyces sp. RB6PN25]|uniref:Universal stress protein n=1 Tax=Streptomyces humicola TaxID=2953240 RepID=A0ABT1Q1T2_9ACTN|nr:universal stress protein [Streptomyces humicola]MCQ4083895.1 universal stress protein [Streptomyces humicola]